MTNTIPANEVIYIAFLMTCTYVAVRAGLSIIRMTLYNMLTNLENKLRKIRNADIEEKAEKWCKENPIEDDGFYHGISRKEFFDNARDKKLGLNMYEPAFRHSKQFVGVQMDLFPMGNYNGPVGMG